VLLHLLQASPAQCGHGYSPSAPAPTASSAFAGFNFPLDVIVVAVLWYLRFGLSYRDVEELLAERRIAVEHVTVYTNLGAAVYAAAGRRRAAMPVSRWGPLADG
jgi:transposase-like protein